MQQCCPLGRILKTVAVILCWGSKREEWLDLSQAVHFYVHTGWMTFFLLLFWCLCFHLLSHCINSSRWKVIEWMEDKNVCLELTGFIRVEWTSVFYPTVEGCLNMRMLCLAQNGPWSTDSRYKEKIFEKYRCVLASTSTNHLLLAPAADRITG